MRVAHRQPLLTGRTSASAWPLPALVWTALTWSLFGLLAVLSVALNALPALAGDEYGSLHEAEVLGTNLHALGYFVQLHFWQMLAGNDLFLRALSLLWTALGIYWMDRWLATESLAPALRRGAVLLLVANPFLWMYGLQVRFYAFFLAAGVLSIWRFRAWQGTRSRRNAVLLLSSAILVCSAHLFGVLVVGTLVLTELWLRPGRKRLYLPVGCAAMAVILLIPQVHDAAVAVVYRLTAIADIPATGSRGLSLAMIAKIPLTFFFFTLGERVYPLAWWFTAPAMLLTGVALLLGLWRIRHYPGLNVLVSTVLLSVPVLYLVLDPLAPPTLQGAAPRYVIYALPVFALVIALGASTWRPLIPGLACVTCIGLAGFFWPSWSAGGADLMNWPQALRQYIPAPEASCVVVDGRARAPVQRYAPAGTTIVDHVDRCAGYQRVLLISNDYQLANTRPLDGQSSQLGATYVVAESRSLFPAQITVYDHAADGATGLSPARLGLPEQDLQLPLRATQGWTIPGFVRLDATTPSAHIPLHAVDAPAWIVTNYQTAAAVPDGTEVAKLVLHDAAGAGTAVSLRAGVDTANWAARCSSCSPVAGWRKRFSLVGAAYYPDAYREYDVHLWGTRAPRLRVPVKSIDVTSLLPDGTFYFWGVYTEPLH
ncbi:MAG TPA: hypothetical protein VM536_11840 [Chloroflexia bacterium]|nr:hypothetical protein [Chloroflexia bacterium]